MDTDRMNYRQQCLKMPESPPRIDIIKNRGRIEYMDDSLNPWQREEFFRHCEKYQDDNWTQHAAWANREFGTNITPQQACSIYMRQLVG